ncbi:MAG: cytochrome c peroxidase [Nitrospiraceae bacterium]
MTQGTCISPRHSVSRKGFLSLLAGGCLLAAGCSGGNTPTPVTPQIAGTAGAEESLGERLFLETRFAQAFKTFVENGGDPNNAAAGDPGMDTLETLSSGAPLDGPFRGQSMNCRACHLVDDTVASPGGGMRSYADFARRSPVPARTDAKTHAPRNSPPLVNASLDRPDGPLFHHDAEFNSMEDLVAATFTGRNLGWVPGEREQAIAHIARIVRADDGKGDLAKQFDGLPYRTLFTGNHADIPDEFRLPPEFRAFVGSASDQEIFTAVVKVVSAYVKGLVFMKNDDNNVPIRSPYDVFVERNGLPAQPDANETALDYSRRLRQTIAARQAAGTLQFVTSNPNRPDGAFQFHTQPFVFDATALDGLKIFLAEPTTVPPSGPELAAGRIGNCIACHQAPHFTDFKLHNTGTTQKEYDAIHGAGQFATLSIPSLAARNAAPNQYLPASEEHPAALEPFRAIPVAGNPTLTDLGVWNVFANPDMPAPQAKIRALLCDGASPCATPDATLLDRAVARFKTPGLRDLNHSEPFMHNGQFNTVEDVMTFYRDISTQARAGTVRNAAPELRGIALQTVDIPALTAFLKALNEDYQ